MQISVIIPAYNEEGSIGHVVADIDRELVGEVIVVNNGSSDNTREVAQREGARVVDEPRRGYGWACLAGIAALEQRGIVVFMDGDYSDYPENIAELAEPIQKGEADLVIGSRVALAQPGSLSPPQRFGNALATRLLNLFFGVRYSDLGPFRAIRWESLEALQMRDKRYGWTIEMQMKGAALGLREVEIDVPYRRRRAGKSKVSGNLKGSVLAGSYILFYLLRAFLLSLRVKGGGERGLGNKDE